MSLIEKASGVTESEKRLAKMAEKSFLSLWCYPNLFRDQGRRNSGDRKEICDLLVVFGDDIIIFSDKSCSFPNKSPDLDWRRWLKKAVFEAAEQAYGPNDGSFGIRTAFSLIRNARGVFRYLCHHNREPASIESLLL